MTKEEGLHSFWSTFGTAYDENTAPLGLIPPYITYEVITDNFGRENVLRGHLWDKGTSWDGVTATQRTIEAAVGLGGKTIKIDGGMMWIKRGTPFAQRMNDEDDSIRHIVINIEVEYITEV